MKEKDREALARYRIQRARETFDEVSILIENGLWNTAVNRLYYASYYAVIALLIKHEINTNTHAGVRQMFGLHFVKTGIVDKELGKFYSSIFTMRQNGDYEDYFEFSEEEVLAWLEPADELINKIEELLKVNE
ncbi:HEPN domain-containing protein [Persicitalea sp.]|uniref:HEPN domain-containing protein n=1 Tax=Persicitalea sp. TaxID=3100273 RepID=UPI003593D15F